MTLDVYSRRFALRIATMIDSHLISYKHYYPWADRMIAELEEPPNWILEIAIMKYRPHTVEAIRRFAFTEPFESFDMEDEHVACLFLRFESGAISWATFLEEAGAFTDSYGGGRFECGPCYRFLNVLEDNEYARHIEVRQRDQVKLELSTSPSTIRPLYQVFRRHFRAFVANNESKETTSHSPC